MRSVLQVILLSAVATAQGADFARFTSWLDQYTHAPSDGLAAGAYDASRLAELTPYLPPGYVEEFDFPELAVELTPTRHYAPHALYTQASERFIDQASIGAGGELVGYTAGRPFSLRAIAAAPPEQAGYMVAWNHIRRWQYYGYHNEAVVSYIKPTADGVRGTLLEGMQGGGHVDRSVTMFYHRVYLSGLAMLPDSDYRMAVDGADELLFKEYIEMLSPFDIAGLKLVIERPIDQRLGDQVNSYLPSERRVRRLSAKERADSWLGTNWTMDDFEGYSGLVLDNTWRYLGRKVVLHVPSSKHKLAQMHGPLSIIPLDRWQLRPCFVVEAVPKWDGHSYGRRVLFVDEETGSIALALIFDRTDRLLKVISTVYEFSDDLAAPPPELSTPRWRASTIINLEDRTANLAQSDQETAFEAVDASYVKQLFSVSNLTSGR
jgi:hypothetical protein